MINKFSLPTNAGWSGTQNKTAMSSTTTTTPLFRKVILCTLLPLLLLGAVKTAAQDYSMALVNVDNVSDDRSLHLDGASSVTTAIIGTTTYLFVAGNIDSGVSVFRVDDGGLLASVQDVTDDATLELRGANSVTTAVARGTTHLFVAGLSDDGVSVFSVANDGTLTNQANVTDDGMLELRGANSVTTAVAGGTTWLFVAGFSDDGVNVFSIANDGMLTSVTNVTDANDSNWELDGASSVTTAVVAGTTYLFVAGSNDSGVSVFSVANDGMLANVTNVDDANDSNWELDGAQSVTTAVVAGTTYLFVAGSDDSGVSVFSVANDGMLANVTNVPDVGSLELDGAYSVTTAVVAGTTYLFVSGAFDDGVSVFSVANNGLLASVTNVTDAGSLQLDGANSVTTAVVTDTTYLFVTGYFDDGVSVFRVEDAAAPTFGSETASDQTFAISCGAVSLQLPEATSGNGTLTYTLTPAIPGLTLDPVTGMLSGTPATPAAAVALTYTVTDEDYNLTDADSPSLTFMVTVTADDITEPVPDVASLPALTGECSVMPAAPAATDNCDTGSITGTTTTSLPVTSTSTITWTYEDSEGNMTTQTQMVTISDETGPDPDMPSLSALTGECMVETPAAPIATDNCDAGTITGTTDAIFPITTNAIITWTFTDETNNTTTQDQQVTITGDMTAPDPDMTSLPVLTGECSVMPAAPTAMDNCDTGRITGITTTGFPVTETSVITWTFTDMAGNETIQTQDVVIDDVTIPVPEVDPLPALTGQCRVEMATAPIATDNCDGSITGTTDAFPVTSNSTITWTFTDMAGNMATQTQEVVVDVIVPAPEIGRLPALTGQCGRVEMPVAPTATDNCTPRIMGITDAVFPITTNSIIIWTFTDASGNEVRQTQQITIMDVTRPAVDVNPLPVLTGECMVEMPGAPTATDNCDGRIPGITTATFPVTTTSGIIWTFTNMAGNETRQTQQVTITDATRPVPDETSLPALTGECRVNMPAAPIATDICAGSITGITTAIFPVTRDATITWTFTDAAMNETTQDQQVTITGDETGPDPDMPSLPALSGECSVMPAAPTAMDNCDTGSITGTTTATFPVTATSMITWTFTDRANNTTTQDQQVTITGDITAPVPDETSLSALTGECSVMPAAPTATDNCDAGSITGTTDAIFPITADATITWTFTDDTGNTATQTQEVTCMPLGVEEEPGISMYPNPSEGSLAFSTGNYGSFSIKIYRIDGALVFAGIARDNTPINIETLAAGSYVVQATSNGTTVFTSRLLKRDQGLLRG